MSQVSTVADPPHIAPPQNDAPAASLPRISLSPLANSFLRHIRPLLEQLRLNGPEQARTYFARRGGAYGLAGEDIHAVIRQLSQNDELQFESSDSEIDAAIQAAAANPVSGAPPRNDGAPARRIEAITAADFAGQQFAIRYLVDQIMVEHQPMIIGGRSKTLKTTIGLHLALALSTGRPLLGRFAVPKAQRCWFISGESGKATIQATARRIAATAGIRLQDAIMEFGFTLPRIGVMTDLEQVERTIVDREIKVLFVDPLYLSLLNGSSASATNLYETGALFERISLLGQRTNCTMVLIHHFKRGNIPYPGAVYRPPDLEDLTMAGATEWARQWLLLGRREPYADGTAEHKLWIRAGGSAGHSSLWGLDLREAQRPGGFEEIYQVNVIPAGEVQEKVKAQQASNKAQRDSLREEGHRQEILLAIAQLDVTGWSARRVRDLTGKGQPVVGRILLQLVREGYLELTQVGVGRSQVNTYRRVGPE